MWTWIKTQIEAWLLRREMRRSELVRLNEMRVQHEFELERQSNTCNSCENLKMQNAYLQSVINKLMEPKEVKEVHATNMNIPIVPRIPVGWREQRHKLEQESRKQADELLKAKNEELEQKLVKGKTG